MIKRATSFWVFKLNSHVTSKLPVPINISNIWNFGRCLGLFLVLQVVTGLILAGHYTADTSLAFDRIVSIRREVSWGWLLRASHLNMASFFFFFLYIHICRGLYYGSYKYISVWLTGFRILILSMITAFIGYVLPWGQISFWGATVITNLISSLPIFGHYIVQWVWGGFGVCNATLTRFFIVHFCTPLFLISLVFLHIFFLHKTGRQNPSNIESKYNILRFHPFFGLKDLLTFLSLFLILELLVFLNPFFLGDPENFSIANILTTPDHIVPEWYFLFAYAVLRCIPRKGLGVLAIFASISIILLPVVTIRWADSSSRNSKAFWLPVQQILWLLLTFMILLTWLGGQAVSAPYVLVRQLVFFFFLIFNILLRSKPLILLLFSKP